MTVGQAGPDVEAPPPPPTPSLPELAGWAAALGPEEIPDRVRELAASQVLSQLASIRAGAGQPVGRRLMAAFGPPLQADPCRSACVLAGLGSWLNLDDTAYAGHLSSSTVAVPVAFARAGKLDGLSLVTAVVAANECAARITAAATLGPLRGQSAVHTHLAGAVAGRLHCEGAPAEVWADALSLAFGMPNWPLMRAFLASDSRLFGAFTPVRTAMDACDAARAGLHGAADLMEHPDGFLARFATVGLPEAISTGLGRRWHTDTLSFKLRPGGPGIDAAVDCALQIHGEQGPFRSGEIVEVVVETSHYTLLANRMAVRHGAGPGAPLGVLVLHIPFPVATALLTGELTVADFTSPARDDPDRWRLAERVRLVHDPAMTRELFAGQAPFGEAVRQAGASAAPWLRSFGGEEMVGRVADAGPPAGGDFAEATKRTGARVTVHLVGGRAETQERLIPLGAAGPHTRANHAGLVRAKFLELGGAVEVADAAPGLERMTAADLASWIEAALR